MRVFVTGPTGAGLKMPVRSITPNEARDYFGWMADLAQIDLSASSARTRQQLDWNPAGTDLLTDDLFHVSSISA